MVHAILFFFAFGHLVPRLNSNFMVLVPNSSQASQVNHFRPIVLDNFYTRLFPKFLMTGYLVQFLRWYHIMGLDLFMLEPSRIVFFAASKCMKLLDKESFGGSISLKVDIRQAFDIFALLF